MSHRGERELNIVAWCFFTALCLVPFSWQIKFLILSASVLIVRAIYDAKRELERTNWLLLLLFNSEEDVDKRIESINISKNEILENHQDKEFEKRLMIESGAISPISWLFRESFSFIGLLLLVGFILYLTTNFEGFLRFISSF